MRQAARPRCARALAAAGLALCARRGGGQAEAWDPVGVDSLGGLRLNGVLDLLTNRGHVIERVMGGEYDPVDPVGLDGQLQRAWVAGRGVYVEVGLEAVLDPVPGLAPREGADALSHVGQHSAECGCTTTRSGTASSTPSSTSRSAVSEVWYVQDRPASSRMVRVPERVTDRKPGVQDQRHAQLRDAGEHA